MGKRYYWLKLKEDFFKQKEIKRLRKIAGGDTYTIIYLKLQLLSLKNEGMLVFEGYEDDFYEEMALEIDESVPNVKVTLLYLEKHKLIEMLEKNEYFLTKASECIGTESASAKRVRAHRKKMSALQSNAKALQSNTHVTKCNTEIEIEKELDLENREVEVGKKQLLLPETIYQKNIGLLTSHIAERIQALLDDGITEELMIRYIEVAVERNIRNWAYIEKMAIGNLEDNIKTLEQYCSMSIERNSKNTTLNNQNNIPNMVNFDQNEVKPGEYDKYYYKVEE